MEGLFRQRFHLFFAVFKDGVLSVFPFFHNLQQLVHLFEIFQMGVALLRVFVDDVESFRQKPVDVDVAFILQLPQQFFHYHLELHIVVWQLADILFDSHTEKICQPNLNRIVHAEVEVKGRGTYDALDKAVDGGYTKACVII